MDVHLLMAEHRRVTEAFRAKLARVAMLRTQLIDALTDEERGRLYATVDEVAAASRELGDKLLQLDDAVRAMLRQEAAPRSSPLLSAPLDF